VYVAGDELRQSLFDDLDVLGAEPWSRLDFTERGDHAPCELHARVIPLKIDVEIVRLTDLVIAIGDQFQRESNPSSSSRHRVDRSSAHLEFVLLPKTKGGPSF